MSSRPPLLEAYVDPQEDQITKLREEIRQLKDELQRSENRTDVAKRDATAAVNSNRELRKILTPLHRALRMIFGELDAISTPEVQESASMHSPRVSGVWESWKQKLGGKQAEFIQVLLEHGEMSAVQLKIATRCGQQTVYDTIFKLNKAGLIIKNGGRYSLKEMP